MKTILNDRTLWFDGANEVEPEKVPELLLHGVSPSQIVVTHMNEDVKQFNLVDFEEVIHAGKQANEELSFAWDIPMKYQTMDLDEYILDRAHKKGEKYVIRAMEELLEIRTRGLGSIFKTLIYIIDTLRSKNQLWGVGRGSSCASLVLHLIGVHEVDPVKYAIPASEFYHD
jgi:DNA polymerase III alpha subunit